MADITLNFQAFIPKSLGKPLLSYFRNDHRFNKDNMVNYNEFRQKLMDLDRERYTWLPEPEAFGESSDTFFATDINDFHDKNNDHSSRLAAVINLNSNLIGNYSNQSARKMFAHEHDQGDLKNNTQHSDYSHQVKAVITEIPQGDDGLSLRYRDRIGMKNRKYVGKVTFKTERSKEEPIKYDIRNVQSGTYMVPSGHDPSKLLDSTIIEFSASAGYPFSFIAPPIDFNLRIKAHKVAFSNTVEVEVQGSHNLFPAYELLLNRTVIYTYNPKDHGYDGPGLINLNLSTSFVAKGSVNVSANPQQIFQ